MYFNMTSDGKQTQTTARAHILMTVNRLAPTINIYKEDINEDS